MDTPRWVVAPGRPEQEGKDTVNTKAARLIAAFVVACSALTLLVGLIVRAPGFTVRSVPLYDAGVWVTNDHEGFYGRLNRAAGALDAGFFPPGSARKLDESILDVLQDAGTVVAVDRNTSTIYPVDVRTGVALADQGVVIADGAVLDLRGGTMAALDPETGKVWAIRYRSDVTAGVPIQLRDLAAAAKPLATLTQRGRGMKGTISDLAVSETGAVFAADVTGQTVRIEPGTGSNAFGEPQLGRTATRQAVSVTLVGPHTVIADPVARTVQIGEREPELVPGEDDVVLQQPGPEDPDLLVSTSRALFRLPIAGGAARSVFGAGTGAPARPVVVNGCGFAAWAGQRAATARSCGAGATTDQVVERTGSLRRPVLRVNRGQVVINDLADGKLFDVEERKATDNWVGLVRPKRAATDYQGTSKDPGDTTNRKPTVERAEFGARAGRMTVLPVLDHVSDPAGRVLAVTEVSGVKGGTAAIAPDLQTVRFTLNKEAKSGSFTFTVNAGGPSATGRVTVRPKSNKTNTAPTRRKSASAPLWTVPAGGVLTIPVLGSWRDAEGDAMVVESAAAPSASVQAREGALEVTAPAVPGPLEITYRVTDGRKRSSAERVRIEVQDPQATTRRPATTRPDVVVTEAGRAVQINPLANDLPGSDPTSAAPHLALDGDPTFTRSPKKPLTVVTDLEEGTLRVMAKVPGTYTIRYQAAYGTAKPAEGEIRVEVQEAGRGRTPLAMPDTATIRGLSPVLVDVLGNDRDPAGALLTVQSAVATPADSLSVAVVGGRWLRITPTGVETGAPPLVTYTVTNGKEEATGQVDVAVLPAVEEDLVTVRADTASVRTGDSVLVPVLDNDSALSGSALTLLATVPDAPAAGRLRVTDPLDPKLTEQDEIGAAYVSGQSVRYLAPSKVTAARTVNVEYVALTETGESASGRLTVTVNPLPTGSAGNGAPTPADIEARVVQGGSVTIPVPVGEHDPDGDTTMVTGLASAPRFGRLMAFSPNSLTYQAYPDFTGADSFRYAVTDAFGGVGEATVRIAIAPVGDPQLAVPIPDSITASPGATVTVSPLANDLFGAGDPVHIVPLADHNTHLPEGVGLLTETGPVTAKVPGLGESLVIKYGLTGNAGPSSLSTVTVRAAKDAQIPPRITDHVAKATSVNSTTVDVLANALDPDGDSGQLTVDSVGVPDATVKGGRITIPVTDAQRAVPYVVKDAAGSSAAAVVYVPAAGSGGPFAKPGAGIELAVGKSRTVDLAELISSPTGDDVVLADVPEPVVTTPADAATTRASRTTLTVRAGEDAGPAAVVLAVTDRARSDAATPSLVSIPVQIGDDAPQLRCPDTAFDLVAGGRPVDIDIASACQVWTADPADAARLTFDATWSRDVPGVTIQGSGTDRIRLAAGTGAKPGAAGEFTVAVTGEPRASAVMRVRVTDVPLPTIVPVRLDHVAPGRSVVVDIAEAMTSPLPNPVYRVLSATPHNRAPVSIQANGSRVTLTPAADASGILTVGVSATDSASADRQVHGLITLSILGTPDPPTDVTAAIVAAADSAEVSWRTGAANGSPIDHFAVEGAGRTTTCIASPCRISGLPRGEQISFVVRAHNEAGYSAASRSSAPIRIDQVPNPPSNFAATATDGSVRLTWNPPAGGGSSVTGYRLTWAPGTGGGFLELGSTTSGVDIPGLTNGTTYVFSLVAFNEAGQSVPVSATGTPVAPPRPIAENLREGAATTCGEPAVPCWPVLVTLSDFDGAVTCTLDSGEAYTATNGDNEFPALPYRTSLTITCSGDNGSATVSKEWGSPSSTTTTTTPPATTSTSESSTASASESSTASTSESSTASTSESATSEAADPPTGTDPPAVATPTSTDPPAVATPASTDPPPLLDTRNRTAQKERFMTLTDQDATHFAGAFDQMVANIEKAVRGKTYVTRLALTCLIAGGHLLVEDNPGTGKTQLAKALANTIEGTHSRIQFTPDLLPTDITGVSVYDQSTQRFAFRPGPVFASIVLADEINRASPKTQSALLEVMEEGRVTVDGQPHGVGSPFMVIATQNPIEQAGTYRLPEAQLDRFLMKTSLGYPDHDTTVELLADAENRDRSGAIEPILRAESVRAMSAQAGLVHVDPSILSFIALIGEESRRHSHVSLGLSVRGGLAFVRSAKTWALSQGRPYVTPDDVKGLAQPVLAHRILLGDEAQFSGVRVGDVIDELIDSVPAPAYRP